VQERKSGEHAIRLKQHWHWHRNALARGEGAAAQWHEDQGQADHTCASPSLPKEQSHSLLPLLHPAQAHRQAQLSVQPQHRERRWAQATARKTSGDSTDRAFEQIWLTECGGVRAAASRCFCYPDLAQRRDRHPQSPRVGRVLTAPRRRLTR
jgi:hypothetical protein